MKVVIGICFVCLAYHGVNAIDCGNPTTENGITSFDNTTYGSLANISCDQGYTLIDENNFTIYCQDDGQWSSAPVCVQGCDNPQIKSQLSYEERTYLSNISLVCLTDGYILHGTPYIICQTNGSWTKEPQCYAI
ncbi:apolipoprotein R-like, partial [Ruditapes philippinarum]|uniref:apolipoprotein R-like n=1 Tax=Ruditapes philippinarum TaxID=129788 RepID=UPI00295BD5D3